MNGRGEYGSRLLYGGSVYSSPPWGGAPDPTAHGWPYRGARAFHGHEAPTFARRGSWPPRREAGGLGRGELVTGNDRGTYGAIARHEAIGADWAIEERREDLKKINDGINSAVHEMILAMGGDPSAFSLDPVAFVKDPADYKARFEASLARMKKSPLYPLWQSLVSPTLDEWNQLTSHGAALTADRLSDLALKAKPLDWQDRMLKMRSAIDAEMKKHGTTGLRSSAPPPVSTSITQDITEIARKTGQGIEYLGEKGAEAIGDVWKFAKYFAWTVLGVGAVFVLSSVAANLKKGRDPAQKWVEYAGRGARRTEVLT